MKSLNDIKKLYFLGIGGIGMSALARYFKELGVEVSGYDKTRTALTDRLVSEGIAVHFDDNAETCPRDMDLVIYTPAIPADHTEFNFYRNGYYPMAKRSEVLGIISASRFAIAVSGSHGKTTVSSMIAHVLKQSGFDCSAFLGGIAINYDSNYISGKNDVVVIEADEFDRSFHRLHADIAVITAVDSDHLDIYGTKDAIEDAFVEFTQKMKSEGLVIANKDVQILSRIKDHPVRTYHLKSRTADLFVTGYQVHDGSYHVNFSDRLENERSFILNLGGFHNVENAMAAISVADKLGIDFEKVKEALASFKGIHRRFETRVKNDRVVYVDDYAHHPQEINVFLDSLREMYPGKKITAVFQPHLFTRTRDLAEGFAESLSKADKVFLLDIYPARELPIHGITSQIILDKITCADKEIISKKELLEKIAKEEVEVFATIGAGDIDTLVKPLEEILSKR